MDERGDPRISEAEGAEVKLLIYIYSYILLPARVATQRRMNDACDVVVVVVAAGGGATTKYAKRVRFRQKHVHNSTCTPHQ